MVEVSSCIVVVVGVEVKVVVTKLLLNLTGPLEAP